MLSCTFVTAQASDHRKEKKELTLEDATRVVKFKYHAATYDLCSFVLPDNQVLFTTKVLYLRPANEPKPENTNINGVLNDRKKLERKSSGQRTI